MHILLRPTRRFIIFLAITIRIIRPSNCICIFHCAYAHNMQSFSYFSHPLQYGRAPCACLFGMFTEIAWREGKSHPSCCCHRIFITVYNHMKVRLIFNLVRINSVFVPDFCFPRKPVLKKNSTFFYLISFFVKIFISTVILVWFIFINLMSGQLLKNKMYPCVKLTRINDGLIRFAEHWNSIRISIPKRRGVRIWTNMHKFRNVHKLLKKRKYLFEKKLI